MGAASSVIKDKDKKVNIIDCSSDEVRPCEICNRDIDVCGFNLCGRCCKRQANPFYFSSLVHVLTSTLKTDSKVSSQIVPCGTIGQEGALVFITRGCYEDETFDWTLRYLHGQQFCYVKRQPNEKKSYDFPGDMCFDEEKNYLYITIPCRKRVYCLTFDYFRTAFKTPLGSCFGITLFNNGFALSIKTSATLLNSKWQVQFVNREGKVLHRIQNKPDGQDYFEEPLNIASNKDKNILFVSDKGRHAVFAFNASGQLMYHYNDSTVRSPLGIAADKFNNVYVTSGRKIFQIQKGGERARELSLDIKDKIVSVCMDFNSDTLTIISKSGHVASFEFEPLKLN